MLFFDIFRNFCTVVVIIELLFIISYIFANVFMCLTSHAEKKNNNNIEKRLSKLLNEDKEKRHEQIVKRNNKIGDIN